MKKQWVIIFLFALLLVGVFSSALADGTETLGPPSIPIASGTGIAAAGTGMVAQPGSINISVPANATVKQVLLYWEGTMTSNVPGDDTIIVNGSNVTGSLIGGQTFFFNGAYTSSFRADITSLDLVGPGDSTLTLDGLDFSLVSNGAGVLVIYDDGSGFAKIELRDGLDLAFIDYPEPRKSTIPQTFNFPPANEDRTADLNMFFASIVGSVSGGGPVRPTSIEVTSGGTTTVYSNLLNSNDGDEWDTLNLQVTVPAGADSLTVQAFSRDDTGSGNLPASLDWIVAGLKVAPDPDLAISKTCTADVFVGDDVEYEITVTNTGNVTLTDIEVDDSLLGSLETIDSLEAGKSWSKTAIIPANQSGEIKNTVTATSMYGSTEVTDVDSCTTNVYALTVTKDVQTSLVRMPNWNIEKTANGEKTTNLVLLIDQTASVDYEVLVDLGNPPHVDSNWVVSGTITVANPAPMAATLSSVNDVISDFFYVFLPIIARDGNSPATSQDQHDVIIPPGISAPVDCPSLAVPAGGTLVCTYGPVNLRNGLERTNTAVAILENNNDGMTAFQGTKKVDFSTADIKWVDDEVVVTDDRAGVLGTANVNDLPKTFQYSEEFGPFPSDECNQGGQVVNNATFVTNDTNTSGNSDATVNIICLESATTGYEDLPIGTGNDWDYNDGVIRVNIDPAFSPSNDLLSITFSFEQPVNLSAYTHEFHIQPDVFACDGTYSLTRNGAPVVANAPYQSGQDLLIFPDTGNPTNTARLTIDFIVPSPGDCPLDLSGFDPIDTFNGEGLFFVPWVLVKNTGETVVPGDPRMLGVPIDWIWPAEKQGIWNVYPDVSPPQVPGKGPVFTPFWFNNYQP